jgi:hypothetical protein
MNISWKYLRILMTFFEHHLNVQPPVHNILERVAMLDLMADELEKVVKLARQDAKDIRGGELIDMMRKKQ